VGKGGAVVAADLFEQNRGGLELFAFEKKLGGFVLFGLLSEPDRRPPGIFRRGWDASVSWRQLA